VGLIELQALKDRKDLAALLGVKPSALSYLLYYVPDTKKYQKFEIDKKSGGTRKITAPIGAMKAVQNRLADILYDCCDDVDKANNRRCVSHGFRRGRSIYTNAYEHRHKRFVLNLDLADFFPSINFGRVRGFFIKSVDFKLNPAVATAIAQIACFENSLPQGSPCSPVIADLVAGALDARLVKLAKSARCTYTRYADDITFSTNKKLFPLDIAYQNSLSLSEWHLSEKLASRINGAGFSINVPKTRMQGRHTRQLVTGLTVNEKVNIRASYYRSARAMAQNLFATGKYHLPSKKGGNPSEPQAPEITNLNPLAGILSHIHYIRDRADRRERTEKKKNPTATRSLYRKFLFFKYFVDLKRPLIICEGKTDSIYLRSAVKKLSQAQKNLLGADGKPIFSIFNQNGSASEILQLEGGSEPLKIFLQDYEKKLGPYYYSPLKCPVIVLIDNDEGASSVFAFYKGKLKSDMSLKSIDSFYHVHKNLYVIKTPELGASGKSCIEDLFMQKALSTEIDGKSFATGLSKAAFAEKVVLKDMSTIDFSGFNPVFDRILAVINHYKPEVV